LLPNITKSERLSGFLFFYFTPHIPHNILNPERQFSQCKLEIFEDQIRTFLTCCFFSVLKITQKINTSLLRYILYVKLNYLSILGCS